MDTIKENEIDKLTHQIIGCAMKVHSTLGNGFQEVIYQRALALEMSYQNIAFKREMEMNIEGFGFHDNYIPSNQFTGLPLSLAQMGSGEGMQPFKTVKDYDNWIKRATAFSVWTDSAIVYFKKGIAAGFVLPKSLVIKMVPQMQGMITDSVQGSLFYGPVK